MAQGDGYHNNMYGAEYLHLPLDRPLRIPEDLEPNGDGFMESIAAALHEDNTTGNEPNQDHGQGQEGTVQQAARDENQIQPAGLLLPREPIAQHDDFFLLYDYESEYSEEEESDLEDCEEDNGENQGDEMDTLVHETLVNHSEVSLWQSPQKQGREDKGKEITQLIHLCFFLGTAEPFFLLLTDINCDEQPRVIFPKKKTSQENLSDKTKKEDSEKKWMQNEKL